MCESQKIPKLHYLLVTIKMVIIYSLQLTILFYLFPDQTCMLQIWGAGIFMNVTLTIYSNHNKLHLDLWI